MRCRDGLMRLYDEVQRIDKTEFNLLGKDYLTEKEAAHYCGVCLRQFQIKRKHEGIMCIKFMGKKLFRKQDLVRAIEKKIG